MDTEWNTLFRFLGRHEPEVSGRAAEDLADELKEQLLQFARGELSAYERSSLIPTLIENEDARLFLVEGLA